MKKQFLSVIALLLATLTFAQQKGMVTIKGTLNGDLKGFNKIYLYTRTTNDSAEIKDGHYTFSFPFSEVAMKMLYPEYIKESHMMYQPFGILIAEPGTYYVTSDIAKGMNVSELKGPEPMMLYEKFNEDQGEAYKKVYAGIGDLYGGNWYQIEDTSANYASLQKSMDSLQEIYMLPLLENLLKQHPDSYASAYVLADSKGIGSIETKEKLFNMLSSRMQKTKEAQKYNDYILGLKSSNVGGTVANFILPDPSGKKVDFADLKGKYVLIDFWASWCSPCRQSFPHMREVYKKYKSDKFEIYSISIDESKAAWLKAVKEENNPWLQSLDTKNISQKGFAVTGVPSTFLIDPQGKIVAKEVGFDPDGNSEIEKKLGELLAPGK
ncbi:MAG: TlpA disulfide reductase family protein [Ginsengibacter sp.]